LHFDLNREQAMESAMEFWATHVAAVQREGVSASGYAKRHDMSLASLYYWCRKLKASEIGAVAPTGKFVALRMADPVPSVCACTLVLASGLRLELPALPAPAWLAALEQARCGAR
jgi:transposase-like protein